MYEKIEEFAIKPILMGPEIEAINLNNNNAMDILREL